MGSETDICGASGEVPGIICIVCLRPKQGNGQFPKYLELLVFFFF